MIGAAAANGLARACAIGLTAVQVGVLARHLVLADYGLVASIAILSPLAVLATAAAIRVANELTATRAAAGADHDAQNRALFIGALELFGLVAVALAIAALLAWPWLPWDRLLNVADAELAARARGGLLLALLFQLVAAPLVLALLGARAYDETHVIAAHTVVTALLGTLLVLIAVRSTHVVPVAMVAPFAAASVGSAAVLAWFLRARGWQLRHVPLRETWRRLRPLFGQMSALAVGGAAVAFVGSSLAYLVSLGSGFAVAAVIDLYAKLLAAPIAAHADMLVPLWPHITADATRGRHRLNRRRVLEATLLSVLYAVMVAAAIWILGPTLLRLLTGRIVAVAPAIFLALSVHALLLAVLQVWCGVLSALSRARTMALALLATALSMAVLASLGPTSGVVTTLWLIDACMAGATFVIGARMVWVLRGAETSPLVDVVVLDEPVHDRTGSHQVLLDAIGADLRAHAMTMEVAAPAWPLPGRRGHRRHLLASAVARQCAYPWFARRLFDRGRVTLVMSAGLAHALWMRPVGVRVAVVCHDAIPYLPAATVGYAHDFGGVLRHAWMRHVQARALRRAAVVVVPSERTRSDLVALGLVPDDRIVVLPHRIDTSVFTPGDRAAARSVLGWPATAPMILAVVNGERRKNLPRMLSAVARARQWHPTLRLVLLGLRTVDRPEAEHVMVVGPLGVDEVAQAYRAADCLLHVSLYEGFGYPVAEALASGCPVVAADRGAVGEVAGDAALYVDAFDDVAIAHGLLTLLGDAPLRRRLAEAGLARAHRFTGAPGYAEVLTRLATQPADSSADAVAMVRNA